jgi:Asp-tRNA(Asn)/Glu-tRNA(Gln) amidotransferase A subunit family amidase
MTGTGLPTSIADWGVALRSGHFTCTDATRRLLSAAAASQATINAFITITSELALRQAAAVDEALAAGRDLGPLMGVPVAVKDLFQVEGVATTAGSRLFADRIAPTNAVVVERLAIAGAILIGTANMDQFAFGPHQEDYGRTSVPGDLARYAGGSSGGSAAAVAAGLVLAALGSDAGGSTRFPAACCGLVGFKPSFGAVSTAGVFPTFASVDHVGEIAGDIAGLRDLFAVTADVAPAPARPLAGAPRVAVLTGWVEGCDPTVRTAIQDVLDELVAAGATLIDSGKIAGMATSIQTLVAIVGPEAFVALSPLLPEDGNGVPVAIRELLAGAYESRAVDYLNALAARGPLRAAVDQILARADVLIMPTATTEAWRWSDIDDASLGVHADATRFLPLANLSGHPTVSIPIPSAHLPVGLQITGRLGADAQLLDVAAWMEDIFANMPIQKEIRP